MSVVSPRAFARKLLNSSELMKLMLPYFLMVNYDNERLFKSKDALDEIIQFLKHRK